MHRDDCTYAQGSWRGDCVHRGYGSPRGLGGVIVCTGVIVRTHRGLGGVIVCTGVMVALGVLEG